MKQKMFLSVVGAFFAIVAVLHFLRLSLGWDAVIGGWQVPTWVSGLAVLVGLYLSYTSFRLRSGTRDFGNESR